MADYPARPRASGIVKVHLSCLVVTPRLVSTVDRPVDRIGIRLGASTQRKKKFVRTLAFLLLIVVRLSQGEIEPMSSSSPDFRLRNNFFEYELWIKRQQLLEFVTRKNLAKVLGGSTGFAVY
jgi:hypothetical protein